MAYLNGRQILFSPSVHVAENNVTTFILNWYNEPTQAQIDANVAIITQMGRLNIGEYVLYLKLGDLYMPVLSVDKVGGNMIFCFVQFAPADLEEAGQMLAFEIRYISNTYTQNFNLYASDEFDAASHAMPSMYAVADYVADELSTATGLPVYVLNWYDSPTQAQEDANAAILQEVVALDTGKYILLLRRASEYYPVLSFYRNVGARTTFKCAFADFNPPIGNDVDSYLLVYDSTDGYSQVKEPFYINSTFDDTSDAVASMALIKDYVDTRLGFTQNLTAGANITITNGVIAATGGGGGGTSYDAGTGISISGTTISLDSSTQATLADVANKQNKPSEVTTGTTLALADNTEYRLTDVTTLTLTYPASGNFECWLRLSFAASGTITVTLPTSSYIGAAPVFANGETWELSIKDGVVCAGKVVSAS